MIRFVVIFAFVSQAAGQTVCGFNATATNETQSLTSPDWPANYSPDQNCEWILEAMTRHHVALTIHFFATEPTYDILQIFGTPSNLKFSGVEVFANVMYSVNSTLTLQFTSDETVQGLGFNASFTEIDHIPAPASTTVPTPTRRPRTCGTDLIATSARQPLTSPGYPFTYQNNLDCEWVITARNGYYIELIFDSFFTETDFDILTIIGTPSVVRLSGIVVLNTYYSTNSTLTVQFKSDDSTAYDGFAATFVEINALPSSGTNADSDKCGFTAAATDESQSLTSPRWPYSYGNDKRCEWTLMAQDGFHIQLTFHTFSTERVYDVVTIIGALSGREELSGTLIFQDSFYSTAEILVVQFSSDGSTQALGFNATFRAQVHRVIPSGNDCKFKGRQGTFVDEDGTFIRAQVFFQAGVKWADRAAYVDFSAFLAYHLVNTVLVEIADLPSVLPTTQPGSEKICGFIRMANSSAQFLTSPGWPLPYGNNLQCEWVLIVRRGFHVKVEFHTFFTEERYDYVTIMGTTQNSVRLSGSLTENIFYSKNISLTLQFVTDASTTRPGFNATFIEADELPTLPPITIDSSENNCMNKIQATRSNQTITSPGWPNRYENNLNCEWILTAREEHHVMLTFQSFSTEPRYDNLVILGKVGPVVRYSGSLSETVFYSKNSNLTLQFTTDELTRGSGFRAIFIEIDTIPTNTNKCDYNATATDFSQILISPGYPSDYLDNLRCEWLITVADGFQIEFKVNTINTETDRDIFTIIGASSRPIRLSGNLNIRGSYYSLNRFLQLTFHSDESVERIGFSATFKRILKVDVPLYTAATDTCQFNVFAVNISQVLTSPGWPNEYFHDLECRWNIQARPGYHVNLTFYSFETESKEDYIKIIGSLHNPQLHIFGSVQLDSFYSLKENLSLIFDTGYTRDGPGFMARFVEIPKLPLNPSVISTYTCNNGIAITMDLVCNGVDDCDGSDEIASATDCIDWGSEQLNCTLPSKNKKSSCLLSKDSVCNGSYSISNLRPCSLNCSTYYRCQNNRCLPRSTVCDEDVCRGCEEDEEWTSGIGFHCIRNSRMCRMPQQLLWDGMKDCDQGEDLCYISSGYNDGRDVRHFPSTRFDTSRCFKCLDDSIIIPRRKVCDGIFHCSDLSDECLCEVNVPSLCHSVVNKLSITSDQKRGIKTLCDIGQVSCGNDTCIHRSEVCDSKADCNNNFDEKDSYCNGTLQCKDALLSDQGKPCRCLKVDCQEVQTIDVDLAVNNVVGFACDGNRECPPADRIDSSSLEGSYWRNWRRGVGNPADECEAQCSNASSISCTSEILGDLNYELQSIYPTTVCTEGLPLIVRRCDGLIECQQANHDELNCGNRHYCKNGNYISISLERKCDGRVDCEDGSDETKAACPHRVFCPSLSNTLVSVSRERLCDGHIDCDDNLDEKRCYDDRRFYCENGNPLFVSENQIFDGRQDCSDLSDECPTKTEARNEDVFSSRYQLIANPILRYLVWVMGMLALVGNMVVLFGEGKNIKDIAVKGGSVPLRTNHMLVFNLALADLLMGIYLIMLGVAGVLYDDVFCLHDIEWLSSAACTTMGVLVVISSETSVITLVILTSCRLYSILKPFDSREKPTVGFLVFCIGSSWIVSTILAFLPLVPSLQFMFTDKVFINNNPFFQNATVNFGSAKAWSEKMLTFHPSYNRSMSEKSILIQQARSWHELQKALGEPAVSEFMNITNQFGYYSANSVCIPRLFVSWQDKGWEFALSTTIFNFFAFSYVATAYVYILYTTNKQRKEREKLTSRMSNAEKSGNKMQNKIIRLVATDFCCWVPITIMAFINFSGIHLLDVAYVFAAIVLLPINSALNPILYSDFLDKLIFKTTAALSWFRNFFTDRNSSSSESSKKETSV